MNYFKRLNQTGFLILVIALYCQLLFGNFGSGLNYKHGPLIIFEKEDAALCVSWKIIQQSFPLETYESLKDHIANGVFYHFDDKREIVTTQQSLEGDLYLLQTFIWHKSSEYIITAKCCKSNLGKVKIEMEILLKNKLIHN